MMKKKYFEKEGEIAFRLWVFSLAVAELEANPNQEKARNLYDKVATFSTSPWMEIKSTEEERRDLQKLIDTLTLMTVS